MVLLTERAWKLIPGHKPQTNPELRSARLTEWCWTNFFHVSSELARPISLGACTQHRAGRYRRYRGLASLRRWGQGPGLWGPKRSERSTPPAHARLGNRGAHCLGLSSCDPPRRLIVQSTRGRSQASAVNCLVCRVSPVSVNPHFAYPG